MEQLIDKRVLTLLLGEAFEGWSRHCKRQHKASRIYIRAKPKFRIHNCVRL